MLERAAEKEKQQEQEEIQKAYKDKIEQQTRETD